MTTLDDWVKDEKKRLDEFAAFWRSEQPANPSDFPLVMFDGEWDEQYRCWGGG